MDDPGGRYTAYTALLVDRVLAAPGHTPRELRRRVLARAAQLGGTPGSGAEDVPPALAAYVDKVAQHAYTVTDEDVGALQRAGTSDDALFELTVSAALGAALGRLERGLAALRGEPRSVSERGSAPPDPLSALSTPPDPLATVSSPPDPLSTVWRGGTQE
jgi:hypothetical protein